jgi:hypothetical protein
MLPALLLGLRPWHWVADVCAAPGSKTTQVLDLMHLQTECRGGGVEFPTGLVVANEFDAKRCKLFLAGRVRKVCVRVCLGGGDETISLGANIQCTCESLLLSCFLLFFFSFLFLNGFHSHPPLSSGGESLLRGDGGRCTGAPPRSLREELRPSARGDRMFT